MTKYSSKDPRETEGNGHRAEKNPVDYPREKWLKKVGLEPDDLLPELDLISAEDVEIKPVEWLWENRIPKGKLTMFDGDPDVGKSVVTVDISARVSTGRSFPDGAKCEPGVILIANVEDAADDTIVPRLKAHGADLSKVKIINGVPDGKGGTRLLDLPADTPILRKAVKKTGAVLVIVDPVLTMLGGDANKDQDARKALTPLKDLAEETGIAIVAVRHLNKNVSLSAIQRGGGNMGLIGVARAGAFFAHHPDEDGLRVMAQHKNNLGPKPDSLQYRVVGWAIDPSIGRVEWCGTTEHDANSLSADALSPTERSQLDEAKEFLRNELKDGPMWAKQVYKDARDAGVAERTLNRAKTALRVRSEKIGVDGWQWSLPDKENRRSESEDDPSGNVGNVGNVGTLHQTLQENPPYIKEGCQGCQGCQECQVGTVGNVGRKDGNVQNGNVMSSSLTGSAPGKAREDITKSSSARDRMTAEEVQEYKRLRTMMPPEDARAEVLAKRDENAVTL